MDAQARSTQELPESITSAHSTEGVQMAKMANKDLSALLDSWDESILDSVEDDVTVSSPLILSRGRILSPAPKTEQLHALSPLKVVKKAKRSMDPATTPPAKRSFKRMRDAIMSNLSPPKPSMLPQSASEGSIIGFAGQESAKTLPPSPESLPEHIPLPTTPRTGNSSLPPASVQFSSLQDIIMSFDSALFRQQVTLDSLRAVKSTEDESAARISELERANAALEIQIDSFQRRSDGHTSQLHELEDILAREKDDKRKALQESRGIVSRLEKRLGESQTLVASLRSRVEALEEERARAEGRTDARLFEAQQRVDQMQIEREREIAKWQRRLDEADFAHLALKESGSRLQKELFGRDRRNAELERALQDRDRRIMELERRKR